jgi:HEPN domain-containing protein
MGLPQRREARLFYRAAKQRFGDAELLLEWGRTTGAVYLAGYTVECFLKALVLENVTRIKRKDVLDQFRGARAHNTEWLVALYRRHVGLAVPRDVNQHLLRIASWSTDLRYATGLLKPREADDFMDSVVAVATWAEGRM